jgi:Flp pilus assembly pilin Flp
VVDWLGRAYLAVQGAPATVLGRSHSEQGVSTVQYALLVALVALMVALVVGALGAGAKGLFGNAHSCANGLTTTACRVGSHLQGSANGEGP